MRFQAIASGSNGNALFTDSKETALLIDAGISCKRLEQGLLGLSVDPNKLSGILITHEHSDHIQGLYVFLSHHPIPLYGTPGTLGAIRMQDKKGMIREELYHPVQAERPFFVGDYEILPLSVSHDAAEPVCYRLTAEGRSIAAVTDLGFYNQHQVEALQNLSGILLESNHDVRMLEAGPYPYALKRRILGNLGHLSNENAGKLVSSLLNPELKFILLGHLSEENNYPDLALLSVQNEIDASDTPYQASDFVVEVATRHAPSSLFEI